MNNRQAGRRRGRGGQRQGGNPGRPDNGNRIDNRARGNAAQLLEKYKSLASDAQRSGDRVNTEYYLQFADHYFRVLSETRARFEENNPNAPRQREIADDGDDDDFGFEGEIGSPAAYSHRQAIEQDDEPRQDRTARDDRPNRDDRPQRDDRPRRDRAPRDENRQADGNRAEADREPRNGYAREPQQREAQPRDVQPREAQPREDRPVAANDEPRRRGRPRRDAEPVAEGFDAAVLPPAIGVEPALEAEKRPRRRRVRDDEAIPPAA